MVSRVSALGQLGSKAKMSQKKGAVGQSCLLYAGQEAEQNRARQKGVRDQI